MPTNKKHHFVPRFYLKHFSPDGQSVRLFNFGQNRCIAGANLKNQCYRNYMYGKDNEYERHLAQLEGVLSELLKRMVSFAALPPPLSSDHETLCILTLLQSARTAYAADATDEWTDKMWKQVLHKDPRVKPGMLDKVKIVNTDAASFTVSAILNMYHLIMDLDYRLLVAHDDMEFITSDNPVVKYNQLMEFESFGGYTGLAAKGLQIFFPLSPRYLLAFFDLGVYAYEPRKATIAQVPTVHDMMQLNALQVVAAQENLYFGVPAKADIFRVVESSKHLRRKRMANIIVSPERPTATGTSQIVGGGMEDIRTKLSLSFARLIKPAKRWREERKQPGPKQVVVVRDPALLEAHDTFLEQVKAGKYMVTDFFKYLHERRSS